MKLSQWHHLCLATVSPILLEGIAHIDYKLLDHTMFPALKQLDGHSDMEILLLTYVITYHNGSIYFPNQLKQSELISSFEHYDCSEDAIWDALMLLCMKGWVVTDYIFNTDEFEVYIGAGKLSSDGLLSPDVQISNSLKQMLLYHRGAFNLN